MGNNQIFKYELLKFTLEPNPCKNKTIIDLHMPFPYYIKQESKKKCFEHF